MIETFHLNQKIASVAMKMKVARNGLPLENVKEIQYLWLVLLIIMGPVGRAVMYADASNRRDKNKVGQVLDVFFFLSFFETHF